MKPIRLIFLCCLFSLQAFSQGRSISSIYVQDKLWDNHARIKILFLNGSNEQHLRVKRVSKQWTEYANVDFLFFTEGQITNKQSDIRVMIKGNCTGSFSYVGKQSRNVPEDKPTLCFTDLENFTILHEFGHALGFIHEHFHPEFTPKLANDFADQCVKIYGWDKNYCKDAFIDKHNQAVVLDYDVKSVMQYNLSSTREKVLLKSEFHHDILGSQGILSLNDRLTVADLYPGRISQAEIHQKYEDEIESFLTHNRCRVIKLDENSLEANKLRQLCSPDSKYGYYVLKDQNKSFINQYDDLIKSCHSELSTIIGLMKRDDKCMRDV